jgi:hypothetical protein
MDSDELQRRKRAYEGDHRITVGDLRERLAAFDDDAELHFGAADEGRNPLIFHRLKNRSPIQGTGLVHVELDEVTDEAMKDELAWDVARRIRSLANVILYIDSAEERGLRGVRKPSPDESEEITAIVREIQLEPALLILPPEVVDGSGLSLDADEDDREKEALRVVYRWAERERAEAAE